MGERVAGGTTWVVGDRWAHAHHHVEIPGVGRADRASGLEQGLGTVRLAGEVTPRSGKELRARSVHDLDPRMVDQVPAHAGDVGVDVDRVPGEILRRTDAASKQDRGGAVGARGQDHEVGNDLALLAADPDHRPHGPLAVEAQPIHDRVGHDREVRSLASRIQIGERRVPAHVADRVDRDRRGALADPWIVEVLEDRKADLDRRVETRAHERLEVVHA